MGGNSTSMRRSDSVCALGRLRTGGRVPVFRWKESRERSKMSVSCFAMTLRPMPFLMEDPKPATCSVETRLR